MSVPSQPALPWPAQIRTPTGPAAEGVVSAIRAGINQTPGGGSTTADFNAEGIIQKGYVLNPFSGECAETIIHAGHPVFCARGQVGNPIGPSSARAPGSHGGPDSVPHTIMSLAQLNWTLAQEMQEAEAAIKNHRNAVRGLPGERSELLRYLERDEACWSELFADGGKRICGDRVFNHMYYLCRQGILERWSFLGFSILASEADSQSRGHFAYGSHLKKKTR